MSFYDDASLIMIPSGYKAGKLYSAKPTDGAGDLSFTRTGDTATRVNSSGLIERCRTNLILQSETFGTTWVAGSMDVSSNTFANPLNGLLTADKLIPTLTSGGHSIVQTTTVSANSYNFSIYAKADGYNFLRIRFGSLGITFDLTNGDKFSISTGFSGLATNVGDGWFRLSVFGAALLNESFRLLVYPTSTIADYSGDGTSGVIIYGAQLEIGDIATDYIPTTSAAVTVGPITNIPRLDYTGGGCPKLLMEPQRTNILTYSNQFNNAIWTKRNSTILNNSLTSPDGYVNADKIQENTTNDRHDIYESFSATSGVTYTISIFVKAAERGFCFLSFGGSTISGNSAFFNLSTGEVISSPSGITSTITNYGNGWYRITSTGTASSSGTAYLVCGPSTSSSISYQGVSGNGIYAYGAQLEAGSYATSYIPTFNATVTRNQEEFLKTSISSLIGQTEGTIFIEYNSANITGVNQSFEISDGTLNNRINLRLNSNNNYQAIIVQGGSIVLNQSSTSSFTQNQRVKIALAYKSSALTSVYVNGVQVVSGTSGAISGSFSAIYSYQFAAGLGFVNSNISNIIIFKNQLSNSDLATLTTL